MLLSIGSWRFDGFRPLAGLRRSVFRLAEMRRMAEGRRAIASMDERMLADIGISRCEAREEASRKFWDIGKR